MAIDEYREIKRMKTTFPYILGTLTLKCPGGGQKLPPDFSFASHQKNLPHNL